VYWLNGSVWPSQTQEPVSRPALPRTTNDLISNARTVSTSEPEEFFNALQFPQSD
jgi:hypothetical protein